MPYRQDQIITTRMIINNVEIAQTTITQTGKAAINVPDLHIKDLGKAEKGISAEELIARLWLTLSPRWLQSAPTAQ